MVATYVQSSGFFWLKKGRVEGSCEHDNKTYAYM
jgi:hypothetical protein